MSFGRCNFEGRLRVRPSVLRILASDQLRFLCGFGAGSLLSGLRAAGAFQAFLSGIEQFVVKRLSFFGCLRFGLFQQFGNFTEVC